MNVLAAAVSLTLAVVVSELATRLVRPGLTVGSNERVFFCEYDPRLGWRNRPDADGRFFGTHVHHNGAGQRDKTRPMVHAGNAPRVLVLGDSFVWGYRVEARDRFTDRLEKLMPGSEIMNFGCSGYGQDQEYLLLQREVRRWRPDQVVVAIHAASDLDNNTSSMQYGYYKPLFRVVADKLVLKNVPVPRDSLGTRIDKWMTPRFALWNLLMSRSIGDVGLRTRFVDALNASSPRHPVKVSRSNVGRTEITCRLCATIKDFALKHGATTLFLLIPNVSPHDQTIQDSSDYDRLRACLTDRSLAVLDLQPVFRAYHDQHPNVAITLANDRHWSPEGNAVVSRALQAYFQQHPSPLAMAGRPPAPH